MIETPLPVAAAWVGWGDGSRDWLVEREHLATTWLAEQAQRRSSRIVVQGDSHARAFRDGDEPRALLARAGEVATYKSRVRGGATFVHQPDVKMLANAMRTADGHPVCATEMPSLPLAGWAMATGAIDLSTGSVTPDRRTPEQLDHLGYLVGQLYNGWAHKQVGRPASARVMPLLAASGMSYAVFVGSLLAMAPAYLDERSDIAEMERALPPEWKQEARLLHDAWL